MIPRVADNDVDEITVTLCGREIRGWSYADDTERRLKMRMAREFVEGWVTGRGELLAALIAEEDADAAFDAADEYTHRADVEGWLDDPTGSSHVTQAWDRAYDLRTKAKELRRAAIDKTEDREALAAVKGKTESAPRTDAK